MIHKVRLPSLTGKLDDKKSVEKSKPSYAAIPKEIAIIQRKTDLAQANGEKLSDVLKYDLSDSNMLFDGDIMEKAEKSQILTDIERFLPEEAILKELTSAELHTSVIVDFMSAMRSNQIQAGVGNFKQLLDRVLYSATTVCSSVMTQFIFDSYIDLTIKDSERIRRGTDTTYEFSEIQTATTLPSMIPSGNQM